MEGRPDKLPGRFKERSATRPARRLFVEPALVLGTLASGLRDVPGAGPSIRAGAAL